MRHRLLGLAGLLASAAISMAQPPGGAVRPQVDGREPTPVARDYYEPEAVAVGFGSVPTFPSKSRLADGSTNAAAPALGVGHRLGANAQPTASVLPMGDFASGFRNTLLNHMTVPLGTVPIEN